tara:strand:- start:12226 stop:13209 length:984 start_codon:yes stop_codon:yes gene_type:complete
MNKNKLVEIGQTKLKINRLGMGGAPLAGLYSSVPEETARKVINTYLGHCLGFFDTAPLYGSGISEIRLGSVLSSYDRDSFVLGTKVGRLLVSDSKRDQDVWSDDLPPIGPISDYSYDGTMRSFEESMQRLNLERIDILYIHDPDNHYNEAIQGSYRALLSLREEGVIRAIGVGMNQAKMLARFAREGDFDCFLCAGRYTLIDYTAINNLLPICEERGISVIIGGPYNSGILAQGSINGAKYNYQPAPLPILETVRQIEAICTNHGVPLKAAALQFPLAHPAVISVIPGARSPEEVNENVKMIEFDIPTEFWSELRIEKLLPDNVPSP